MRTAARKLLRQTQLREGSTPFERLPWDMQRFVIDFLRAHLCDVTPANCQVVGAALEYRLRKSGPICPAYLWMILEDDVTFD
jgi:hypothetical protein